MDMEPQSTRSVRPGALAAGAILLLLGVAMLLDTSGTIDVPVGRLIAPLVLIAIGSSILLEKSAIVIGRRREVDANGNERVRLRKRGDADSGLWLIGIGVWMMVSQLHLFGLNFRNSWPLFVVFAGIRIMMRGTR
jgi:hypothetical protein